MITESIDIDLPYELMVEVLPGKEINPPRIWTNVSKWLDDNCVGKWDCKKTYTTFEFCWHLKFEFEEDSVLFNLRWM